ncbi:MAG: arrestin family protein [Armatimonadota bacterium]
MEIKDDVFRIMRGSGPALELYLGRRVFTTGRQLSGVALFRVSKQINIRSLIISVTGCETAAGTLLPHGKSILFFSREVLLTGRDHPRFRHERVSRLWNEFLGRDTGRTLSAGEHLYPFSIPLPASLPPSYQGSAGKIDYTVTARLELLLGQGIQVSRDIPVVFVPRNRKSGPVALSNPSSDGTLQSGGLSINVEIMQRCVEPGKRVTGRFVIANPKRVNIKEVVVSLENCEWVRGTTRKEIGRQVVQSMTIEPENPNAGFVEGRFELYVPEGSSPTVEGMAISVLWFLKLYLNASHPLEFKAPITVYLPQ